MQNTQSNFTVETLVAKYRNYVIEHCPKSCELIFDEDGKPFEVEEPTSPGGNADEQLIATLYKKVTGNNADM